MIRTTRYQGAIIRDHHILLISHTDHKTGRTYWLLPGGGMEPGESEEECVAREMREETSLVVHIERLLLNEEAAEGRVYRFYKTYLCTPVSGEAAPGYEPEPEAAATYAISAVGWFDLREPLSWGHAVAGDAITYPLLLRVRAALGY